MWLATCATVFAAGFAYLNATRYDGLFPSRHARGVAQLTAFLDVVAAACLGAAILVSLIWAWLKVTDG